MRLSRPALAVLVLAASAARAQAPAPPGPPPGPPPHVYEGPPPRLTVGPTAQDMARVYPGPALRQRIGGRAVLHCTVEIDGAVDACRVLSETPPDLGFGAAALRLTAVLRYEAADHPRNIVLPIRFVPAP